MNESYWEAIEEEAARLGAGAHLAPSERPYEPSGARAATDPEIALLPMIDAGDLEGKAVPERQWGLTGWEPWRSCVFLTGIGASGKSLLTQQRMTCSAAGRPFMGVELRAGVSIYISCEDDAEELHRRQDAINTALGVTWADIRGRLILVSLKGMLNKELCTFDAENRMRLTTRWHSLKATIAAIGAIHVGLDNVAHFFTGNENIRNQVAAFAGLLDGLAEEINGVVILLGHPNKAGDQFSGSTAWENQVRARLYLSLGEEDENGISDPDARMLTNAKPNYARRGEALSFIWHRWAFVRPDELPSGIAEENAKNVQAAAENERFLECLAKATEEQRPTSPSPNASNYAPKLFAGMPTARGMKRKHFEAAMQRLFHLGKIKADQPLFQRSNRNWVRGLGLVE